MLPSARVLPPSLRLDSDAALDHDHHHAAGVGAPRAPAGLPRAPAVTLQLLRFNFEEGDNDGSGEGMP